MRKKSSIFRHKRNRRRNHRRAASRWFSPALEWLEPRQMLAGNVMAAVNGGDLVLTGDAASNSVEVSILNGDLVVQGFDNTTINGGVDPFVAFAGSTTVTDEFFASLGAGDDVLTVKEITITNQASIAADAGDDSVGFDSVSIGADLRLDTGHGADMVNLDNISVFRDALIDTSEQRDTVRIADSDIGRDLRVRLGRYKDVIVLDTVTVTNDANINSGNGPDDVVLIDSTITGRLNVDMQLGDDFLYIDPSTVDGSTSVRGGDGDDMVVVEGANQLDSLNMRLGRGTDANKIDTATTINRPVTTRNMEANTVSDEARDTELMHPTDGALTKSDAAGQFFNNIDNTTPTTTGISDLTVNSTDPDNVINLFDAFDDTEDADADLTYTIVRNTNSDLFSSTTIDGVAGTLTLDYAPGTSGTAKITVRATDRGGRSVDARFNVEVISDSGGALTITADFTSSNDTRASNGGLLVTNDPNFTINVTTAPGATVQVDVDGDGFNDGTATANGSGNASVDVILQHNDNNNGMNTVQVRARNSNGDFSEIEQQDVHYAVGTVVRFNTTLGSYDVELFDEDAPNTVGAFLNDLSRNNSAIVHRTVSNFIIQGGGFTFNSGAIQNIAPFAAPPNEFADADPPNTNEEGTLSTAQVNNDINSFTGQWFINTKDNNQDDPNTPDVVEHGLDDVPHTVFGRVIGTGMTVVDEIEAVPMFNLLGVLPNSSAFATVPLRNYAPVYGATINGTVSTGIRTGLPDNRFQAIDGTGTAFVSDLQIGQEISINGEVRTIRNIVSNTQLIVRGEFTDVTDVAAQVNSAIPDDADFIKTTSITKLFDPLGTENTFRVLENAPSGTEIGQVMPTGAQSGSLVFEIDDSAVSEELKLNGDDHFEGTGDAKAVLIEYLSLECPHCEQIRPVVEQLLTDFAGDLLVVRRHQPLTGVFVHAFDAALAAEAAGRQGMFDEMVNELFNRQAEWSAGNDPNFDAQPIFEDIAIGLGLNLNQFRNDMNDPALADRVNRDIDDAAALGVSGTPTFFLNGESLSSPDVGDTAQVQQFRDAVEEEIAHHAETFAIDRFTGVLTVANSSDLDFETNPSFMFNVNVTNGATEIVGVTVNVIDAFNDGAFSPVTTGSFTDSGLLGTRTDLVSGAPDVNNRDHVTSAVDYSSFSNPPTYGPHHGVVTNITPRPTGVYTTEQPDEDLVHNLEHGHVWISYNPTLISNADLTALENLVTAGGEDTGVIVTPRSANTSAIALASWAHLLELDSFDATQIRNFIETNRGHAPEGFIPSGQKDASSETLNDGLPHSS